MVASGAVGGVFRTTVARWNSESLGECDEDEDAISRWLVPNNNAWRRWRSICLRSSQRYPSPLFYNQAHSWGGLSRSRLCGGLARSRSCGGLGGLARSRSCGGLPRAPASGAARAARARPSTPRRLSPRRAQRADTRGRARPTRACRPARGAASISTATNTTHTPSRLHDGAAAAVAPSVHARGGARAISCAEPANGTLAPKLRGATSGAARPDGGGDRGDYAPRLLRAALARAASESPTLQSKRDDENDF